MLSFLKRARRGAGTAGLLGGLAVAVLIGCDTAAPVAPTPTLPPGAPTRTPVPTPTIPAPTPSPVPADTQGMRWDFVGLAGQAVNVVTGPAVADGPIYAGGAGLAVSTDHGANWQPLGLPAGTVVDSIQVSPTDPRILYAGSGASCTGGGAGVQFRSNDGGATWTPLAVAAASLQVDARDPNLVVGMSCQGMVQSKDGGQHWSAPSDSDFARQAGVTGARVRVPANPIGPIYAAWLKPDGSGRIRTSYDRGANWGGDETFFPGLTDVLVDDKRPQFAWALSQSGVLRTDSNGDHWTPTVTGLDPAHFIRAGAMGPYQLGALAAQYSNSGDMDELYVGTYATTNTPAAGAFSSGDLGRVWGRFGGNLGGRNMRSIFVAREKVAGGGNDRVLLYAGTDNGVYKITLGTAR